MNKSLTQNKKKEGGKMGYFTDCGLLVLLSFLRLFYRLPDAGFLIAFLCTVILCAALMPWGKNGSV